MVEPSAIQLGTTRVAESAYVGHFSILGAPNVARGFEPTADEDATDYTDHWLPSRGVTIGHRVTICSRVVIGDGTSIGPGAFIGDGVCVGHDVSINRDVEAYYACQIHDRVTIGEGAWVGGFICNDASIGARAVVFGSLVHRFVEAVRGVAEPPPRIGEEAFVGMGATIVGGIAVHDGAYIAAGSVLLDDARAGRLYAGAPATDHGPAPRAFRDASARYVSAARAEGVNPDPRNGHT